MDRRVDAGIHNAVRAHKRSELLPAAKSVNSVLVCQISRWIRHRYIRINPEVSGLEVAVKSGHKAPFRLPLETFIFARKCCPEDPLFSPRSQNLQCRLQQNSGCIGPRRGNQKATQYSDLLSHINGISYDPIHAPGDESAGLGEQAPTTAERKQGQCGEQ